MSAARDVDYRNAAKALGWHPSWSVDDLIADRDVREVADLLAAEREKARAPFLLLADQIDDASDAAHDEWTRNGDLYQQGIRDVLEAAAADIRRAAEAAQ